MYFYLVTDDQSYLGKSLHEILPQLFLLNPYLKVTASFVNPEDISEQELLSEKFRKTELRVRRRLPEELEVKYLTVTDVVKFLEVLDRLDYEHQCLLHHGPETSYYQRLLSHYCRGNPNFKTFGDVINSGIKVELYDSKNDCFITWNRKCRVMKHLTEVLPELCLLGLKVEDDSWYLDPTEGHFSQEVIQEGLKEGALQETNLQVRILS